MSLYRFGPGLLSELWRRDRTLGSKLRTAFRERPEAECECGKIPVFAVLWAPDIWIEGFDHYYEPVCLGDAGPGSDTMKQIKWDGGNDDAIRV